MKFFQSLIEKKTTRKQVDVSNIVVTAVLLKGFPFVLLERFIKLALELKVEFWSFGFDSK